MTFSTEFDSVVTHLNENDISSSVPPQINWGFLEIAMKKWIGIGVLGFFIIGVLIFIITSLWIGSDVRRYCKNAKKLYEGDCVTALSEMVDDASMPFRDRNHAIWALGQIGNPKALQYITKYYTGKVPEKESPDTSLSQYEMIKAIKLMQGGVNISAIIWRHGIK